MSKRYTAGTLTVEKIFSLTCSEEGVIDTFDTWSDAIRAMNEVAAKRRSEVDRPSVGGSRKRRRKVAEHKT